MGHCSFEGGDVNRNRPIIFLERFFAKRCRRRGTRRQIFGAPIFPISPFLSTLFYRPPTVLQKEKESISCCCHPFRRVGSGIFFLYSVPRYSPDFPTGIFCLINRVYKSSPPTNTTLSFILCAVELSQLPSTPGRGGSHADSPTCSSARASYGMSPRHAVCCHQALSDYSSQHTPSAPSRIDRSQQVPAPIPGHGGGRTIAPLGASSAI